jgi:hypothetical protein
MAVAQTAISLSPTIAAPGSSTVITGSSFVGTSQVTFSGHPAVFQVDSATKITAIVPLAATTGLVAVTTPSGVATSSQSFEVIAETWNAVENFSTASNPNGAWSYGWAPSLGGTFSLLTTNQNCLESKTVCWQNGLQEPDLAFVAKDSTPYNVVYYTVALPYNVLWLGPEANAVIARWTAPSAGNYTIIGSFQAIDTELAPVDLGILRDGATFLFTDSFTFYGEAKSFTLSNISLTAGTTIDFELAYTTDAYYDNVGLIASINLLK